MEGIALLGKPFWGCALYVTIVGYIMRFVGSCYNRERFSPDSIIYRPKSWEKNGQFYVKLGIRKWKDKLPDVSKKTKKIYTKKVDLQKDAANLRRLVQETCVAECVHYQLILLSLPVMQIYKGWVGVFLFGLCVFGNLLFVAIQRYNRPRLLHTLARLEKAECCCEEKAVAVSSIIQ